MTALFWIALVLASTLQAASPGGVTVKGRVVPSDSPAITGAGRVTMTKTGVTNPVETAVGADGSFQFVNVGPGTYRFSATPGALSQAVTISVSDMNISDIELVNPKTIEVTGNVVVENGGLRPPLFSVGFSRYQGGPVFGGALPVNGIFKISLPDADYRVGWGALPAGYFIRSIQSGSVDLLLKPLTIMGAAVPPITVTLGVNSPPPWVKVSGHVTGLPRTSSVTPRVILSDGVVPVTFPTERDGAVIEADGTFTFPMVLPGTYTMSISPSPPVAPPSTTVYVGRKDVDDVQIVVPVTKCVPGRAVVEGDGPIPNLFFSLVAPAGNSIASTASVAPRADGTFGILLVEGERRMTLARTSLPSGYTLKSFTYGGVDLLRDSLRLSSTDTASLLLTFEAAPGSWANVSGRVTGIDPTARPYRIQIPDQRDLSVVVQPDGSFNFGKVLRGNHSISLVSLGGIPASRSLVVAGQDISTFEFAAPPQKEVVGHATVEGGASQFVSFDLVLRGSPAGSVGVHVSSGTDGNFKIPLPEGESQVTVSGIPSGVIKSLYYGDLDLLKGPLRVSRTDSAELRVTLGPGARGGVLGGILSNGPNACDVSTSPR
jgi:hypothetical protein